jgi:hypothetical protein
VRGLSPHLSCAVVAHPATRASQTCCEGSALDRRCRLEPEAIYLRGEHSSQATAEGFEFVVVVLTSIGVTIYLPLYFFCCSLLLVASFSIFGV